MTFIIVSTDLPYFESVYCWYNLTPTFTNPLSLCVKVSPSLWSALLSASQLEKEGFKATPAINSKKQSLRQFYLLFCFLSMIGLVYLCFGFPQKEIPLDLFVVLLKSAISRFLLTCSFPLSFFLLHSFSAFKYHHLFHSFFFFFILRQQSALFVFIPPWCLFVFPFCFIMSPF